MEENVEKMGKKSDIALNAEISAKRAVKKAIEHHAKLGHKVVIWENEQTVVVDAASLCDEKLQMKE